MHQMMHTYMYSSTNIMIADVKRSKVQTYGSTGGIPSQFKVGSNVQGQTVVSNITMLAKEEQAKLFLLTCCITEKYVPTIL